MRKMLTSKLKSNESLFLAAMQKHFALSLHSAEGQVAASSLPPHHTPTRWSSPSSQHPRGPSQRGGEQLLPQQEHFPRGKSVELLLSQNSAPSPWKRKTQWDFAPSPSWPLRRDPQHWFSWFSKLSQFCDNIKPNPSPFVSVQIGFSSSSFPLIFPYPHRESWYPEEGKEKQRERKRAEYKIEVEETSNWFFQDGVSDGDKIPGTNFYSWQRRITTELASSLDSLMGPDSGAFQRVEQHLPRRKLICTPLGLICHHPPKSPRNGT